MSIYEDDETYSRNEENIDFSIENNNLNKDYEAKTISGTFSIEYFEESGLPPKVNISINDIFYNNKDGENFFNSEYNNYYENEDAEENDEIVYTDVQDINNEVNDLIYDTLFKTGYIKVMEDGILQIKQ